VSTDCVVGTHAEHLSVNNAPHASIAGISTEQIDLTH